MKVFSPGLLQLVAAVEFRLRPWCGFRAVSEIEVAVACVTWPRSLVAMQGQGTADQAWATFLPSLLPTRHHPLSLPPQYHPAIQDSCLECEDCSIQQPSPCRKLLGRFLSLMQSLKLLDKTHSTRSQTRCWEAASELVMKWEAKHAGSIGLRRPGSCCEMFLLPEARSFNAVSFSFLGSV